MLPIKANLAPDFRLSYLLAGLLLGTSITGVVFGGQGLYDSYPASLAGLVGQDIFTLVIALPVLLGAMWLTRRGSTSGLLVWAGSLFYVAYSYTFFVVGGFNALFLVYLGTVAIAMYGTVSLVLHIDPDELKQRFAAATPTRLTGGIFIGFSIFFGLMWGGMTLGAIAGGESPDAVRHLVVAIDGSVMLPLLFFGGLKLWRRQAFGYGLGGLLLTKLALTGSGLSFMTVLGMVWAESINPFDAFLLAIFGVMGVSGIAVGIRYLRSLSDEPRLAGLSASGHSAAPLVARS